MATSPDMSECEICLNVYSPWRRAKLLDCRHTCCSLCLGQMAAANHANRNESGANRSGARMNHNEMGANQSEVMVNQNEIGADWSNISERKLGRRRCMNSCAVCCPWCRHITTLPTGVSVFHLPDDLDKMAAVAAAVPQSASVFIRLLPRTTYYLLPTPSDNDGVRMGQGGGRVIPKGLAGEGVCDGGVGPGMGQRLREREIGSRVVEMEQRLEERERGVLGLGEGWRERQIEEDEDIRRILWTRICTVMMVGLALLFFVCIIIQVLTCDSPRFSIISCG